MSAPQAVADVLDAAADLLEKPGAWTQGDYARNRFGGKLGDGRKPEATCWCAIGALEKVTGSLIGNHYAAPLIEVIGGNGRIDQWNDAPGRTQSEVVAALRAAATSARQGETK